MSVLRLSERTVYRLAARGELERVKVGRSTRYRESEVQAFIRERARRSSGQAVA